MHTFYSRLAVLSVLVAGNSFADGIGFNLGPFSLGLDLFNGPDYHEPNYLIIRKRVIDNPICDAISNLNRLAIVVETKEVISSKEKKIVTKEIIVEPYLFAVDREGKIVLRGNTIKERLIKEVTVKVSDDEFDTSEKKEAEEREGFFSGLFTSDKSKPISIQKIADVQVLRDSHFTIPKDYKGNEDKNLNVICSIRPLA